MSQGVNDYFGETLEIMFPITDNPRRSPDRYDRFLKNWEDYYRVVFKSDESSFEWTKAKIDEYRIKFNMADLRFDFEKYI